MAPVSRVTLREITEHDRAAVEALTVTPEQSHYVGGVARMPDPGGSSAVPGRPAVVYRAVYADQEPVGFSDDQ